MSSIEENIVQKMEHFMITRAAKEKPAKLPMAFCSGIQPSCATALISGSSQDLLRSSISHVELRCGNSKQAVE